MRRRDSNSDRPDERETEMLSWLEESIERHQSWGGEKERKKERGRERID